MGLSTRMRLAVSPCPVPEEQLKQVRLLQTIPIRPFGISTYSTSNEPRMGNIPTLALRPLDYVFNVFSLTALPTIDTDQALVKSRILGRMASCQTARTMILVSPKGGQLPVPGLCSRIPSPLGCRLSLPRPPNNHHRNPLMFHQGRRLFIGVLT